MSKPIITLSGFVARRKVQIDRFADYYDVLAVNHPDKNVPQAQTEDEWNLLYETFMERPEYFESLENKEDKP